MVKRDLKQWQLNSEKWNLPIMQLGHWSLSSHTTSFSFHTVPFLSSNRVCRRVRLSLESVPVLRHEHFHLFLLDWQPETDCMSISESIPGVNLWVDSSHAHPASGTWHVPYHWLSSHAAVHQSRKSKIWTLRWRWETGGGVGGVSATGLLYVLYGLPECI